MNINLSYLTNSTKHKINFKIQKKMMFNKLKKCNITNTKTLQIY